MIKIKLSNLSERPTHDGLWFNLILQEDEKFDGSPYVMSCISPEDIKCLKGKSPQEIIYFYHEKLKDVFLSLNNFIEEQAIKQSSIK